MKLCVVCKKKKVIVAFYKNKGNSDGYSNKCKQCARKYTIERNAYKLELAASEMKKIPKKSNR